MKKFLFLFFVFIYTCIQAQKYDVCIVGGGTSGVAAGIQAAQLGAKTVIVEETDWLGGMLTSAGVSATDGNHNLPSGLWAEFRQKIYDFYGGEKETQTGWVSNTAFEPHVGAAVFKEMAAKEKLLTVVFNAKLLSINKVKNTEGDVWALKIKSKSGKQNLEATIVKIGRAHV